MRFSIHPEIFDRFPGMTIAVAIAGGIDNQAPNPAVDAFWADAWQAAHIEANRHASAQSHPRVAPWREAFRSMGLAPRDFRSSIEALMRRAIRGDDLFRVNPLVDFYNAVSLRHVIPVGGFDLATTGVPIELRLTREGDTFQALDSQNGVAEPLPAGEVAYVSGNVTLTRHFVWRQSRAGMVHPETERLFLVAEILGPVGPPAAQSMLDDFTAGLARFFNVQAAPFLLDANRLAIETP